jgi:hypothetical protein
MADEGNNFDREERSFTANHHHGEVAEADAIVHIDEEYDCNDDEPPPSPMNKHDDNESIARCIFRILYVMLTLSVAGLVFAVVMYNRAKTLAPNARNQALSPEAEQEAFDRDVESYRLTLQNMLSPVVKISNLLEATSPQAEALEWLVFEDRVLDVAGLEQTMGSDPYPFYQRYALMTLFFATGGELWEETPWTDNGNVHECNFVGVDCDAKNQVVVLDLFLRRLRGRKYRIIGEQRDPLIVFLSLVFCL